MALYDCIPIARGFDRRKDDNMTKNEANKKGYYFYLKPEVNKLIDTHILTADKRSRSDFLSEAIKYYCCHLDSVANKDVLSNEIVEQLQAVIQNTENRIACCLFKLAGECGVSTYLAAAQVYNMTDSEIQECRNRAFDRVRKQQGFIRLEDATEEERQLYEGR